MSHPHDDAHPSSTTRRACATCWRTCPTPGRCPRTSSPGSRRPGRRGGRAPGGLGTSPDGAPRIRAPSSMPVPSHPAVAAGRDAAPRGRGRRGGARGRRSAVERCRLTSIGVAAAVRGPRRRGRGGRVGGGVPREPPRWRRPWAPARSWSSCRACDARPPSGGGHRRGSTPARRADHRPRRRGAPARADRAHRSGRARAPRPGDPGGCRPPRRRRHGRRAPAAVLVVDAGAGTRPTPSTATAPRAPLVPSAARCRRLTPPRPATAFATAGRAGTGTPRP